MVLRILTCVLPTESSHKRSPIQISAVGGVGNIPLCCFLSQKCRSKCFIVACSFSILVPLNQGNNVRKEYRDLPAAGFYSSITCWETWPQISNSSIVWPCAKEAKRTPDAYIGSYFGNAWSEPETIIRKVSFLGIEWLWSRLVYL